MRVICEERRNKTITLLLSAPISNRVIIGGKYLGILGLLAVIIFLISLMPLSLLAGGELDSGKLAANIIALIFLVMSYTSMGVFMSCVAGHPTTAAITTFGSLLLLWILDWTAGRDSQYSEVFQYLSMLKHFQAIQSGLISSVDFTYFILFITTFIILSIRRLDNDRLQK
jgi:ABC-2 type transport system permease protein